MNSLKTGVVVVVLLGVLYGVYRVLNMPDPQFMTDLAQIPAAPKIDLGVPSFPEAEGERTTSAPPGLPDASPLPGRFPDDEGEDAPPFDTSPGPPLPDKLAPFPHRNDPHGNQPKNDDVTPDDPPRPAPADANLTDVLRNARSLVERGELREALEVLSIYYDSPNLSAQQRRDLQAWLDPLAGKVIYSAEHHLEEPYIVKRGDTLESIAKQFDVPAQLIYNINQDALSQHDTLFPETKLKVLRGPFEATIDLHTNRLTLFVNGLYAGYFEISAGDSPKPLSGTYMVRRKLHPDDQDNPVGEWLVDLGGEMAIHGTPTARGATYKCIVLDPNDAADVTSILSDGSSIRIRR